MLRRSYQPIVITLLLSTFPFILLGVPDKKAALYDLAFILPYLVFTLIAFLALKLSQRRIFFMAFVFIVGFFYLQSPDMPPMLALSPVERSAALALAVPLSFLGIFLLPDIRFPWAYWSAYGVATLLPLLAFVSLARSMPETFRAVIEWRILFPELSRMLFVPAAGITLALLFAATTPLTRDRFLRDFRLFAATSCLPLYYVLGRVAISEASPAGVRLEAALGFLSAGTILTYAIFRLYWRKVYIDELTGIPNRRALNDRLAGLRDSFSVAMTDIDHFKKFNDSYGHEEGDHALRFVAKHLDGESGGRAYRYGGEEICLVLERESPVNAMKLMEGVRQRLAEKRFRIRSSRKVRARTSPKDRQSSPKGEAIQVTISVGVAGTNDPLDRPEDVLISADAALYRAKEMGRNRVVMAGATSSSEPSNRRKRSPGR